MKPIITPIEELARKRFTSKVRKIRNIKLMGGIRANTSAIKSAIDYLETGFSISDASGTLLDACGELLGTKRDNASDEEYRDRLRSFSVITSSQQSRPTLGAYLHATYNLNFLPIDRVSLISGAIGAVFNRAPLGRMIFSSLGSMAPNMQINEAMASATLSVDVYSAATPPNATMVDNAAMMPGNIFPAVWGGIEYERTQRAIRVSDGATIRVKTGFSVLTRTLGNSQASGEPMSPKNTLLTVKHMVISNG
ncbi:hypothetical protein [Yersinia pekkanenii]|uniref:Uncharacterized protein n=1 Tax=Yersinia pekkanenii TaxID=1288385 RepID=A0A0T9P9Y0_9GAMM|nr:hypothetical protein [Yersinia pekkanenii]CNH53563.1 Uncharacterised protein [Yersinia pekkanenii]CRY67549.1 Uncharacterised protein [Yersinia pekkanenii]